MEILGLLISTFGGFFIFYTYSKSLKNVNYNSGNDFMSKFFNKFMAYILIYLFITIWMIFFLGLYFSKILQKYSLMLLYVPILVTLMLAYIDISKKVTWHRIVLIIRRELFNVNNFFITVMMFMLSAVVLASIFASEGIIVSLSKYTNDNSIYDLIKNTKGILIAISDFLIFVIVSVLIFYIPVKIYLYNRYKNDHIAEISYIMNEVTETTCSEIKDINSNQQYISFVDINTSSLICIPSESLIQVKHVVRNTSSNAI